MITREEIAILRRELESYAVTSPDGYLYYLENLTKQIYSVVFVSKSDPDDLNVIILAKIIGDKIVIDVDITDKPLFEALIQAGIPPVKIVLAYSGGISPSLDMYLGMT